MSGPAQRTAAVDQVMHLVRELRAETAAHTGESTGNLAVLEARIHDGLLALQGSAPPADAAAEEAADDASDLAHHLRQLYLPCTLLARMAEQLAATGPALLPAAALQPFITHLEARLKACAALADRLDATLNGRPE